MAFGILLAQLERNGCCMKFCAGQLRQLIRVAMEYLLSES